MEYASHFSQGGLVEFGLADWCFPTEIEDIKITTNELSDSCYYFDMQRITAFIAELKGDKEKAKSYMESAEKTRQAILDKYIVDGIVDAGAQGASAFLLHFEIVEGTLAQKIADTLAQNIIKDNYVIQVGILGFKALIYALPRYGYADVMYKMLNRYEYPSFGYWKNKGATSLWEDWEGSQSLNHHMYGTVIDFLQREIAGVKNIGVAYDEIVLQPYFYAENCNARFYKEIKNGKVEFEWKKEHQKVWCKAVIPQGSKAKLKIAGFECDLEAGEWIKEFDIAICKNVEKQRVKLSKKGKE